MSDLYLLTAPILLLGIVVLLRFVGCGFQSGSFGPSAPKLGAPVAGNGQVTLSWTEVDTDTTGYSYQVNRSNDGQPPTVANTVTDTTYTDTGLTNGTTYTYTVTVVLGTYVEANSVSNAAIATPTLFTNRPPGSVLDTANPLSTNLIGLYLMNSAVETMQGTPALDRSLVDGATASPNGGAPPTWQVADPSIQFNGGASLNSYLDAGVDALFDDMPTSMISIVASVFVTTVANGGVARRTITNRRTATQDLFLH
jgi:Fibronectin type III domain